MALRRGDDSYAADAGAWMVARYLNGWFTREPTNG